MSKELVDAVRQLNDAWLNSRFDDLQKFFHPDVVLVHPRFTQRTTGRDALMASYIDFVTQAKIDLFEAGEPQADVTDNVAVSVYPWRMKYQFEKQPYDESGWDILVWNRAREGWVVVWRTVILKP